MSDVLSNFSTWKSFLGDRVSQAKKIGLSENTIVEMAAELGSFLNDKVDPKNVEERLLKQLWDAGDEEQRKTIASLMIKLVENE